MGNDDAGGSGRNATGQPRAGDSLNALPEGARVAEFEIKRVLGEGGFGIVYLAFDHALAIDVALKEYLPAALAYRQDHQTILPRSNQHRPTFEAGLRSFLQEARLMAQFDHPALVRVRRVWEANGTAYMAMAYYPGPTLREAIRQAPDSVTEAWLKALLVPLFDAVELLHAKQYYHRDIAPDNIIIQPNGAPVLLDFGAARHVIGDMTQALTAVLKPGYAPIEQYAEDAGFTQGPWTDVYGFAATLYMAVSGKPPPAAVSRVLRDSIVPLCGNSPPGYDEPFLRGIDSGLAVRPEERPQTLPAFRAALGMIADADSDRTVIFLRPESRARPSAPEERRTRPIAPEVPSRRPETVRDSATLPASQTSGASGAAASLPARAVAPVKPEAQAPHRATAAKRSVVPFVAAFGVVAMGAVVWAVLQFGGGPAPTAGMRQDIATARPQAPAERSSPAATTEPQPRPVETPPAGAALRPVPSVPVPPAATATPGIPPIPASPPPKGVEPAAKREPLPSPPVPREPAPLQAAKGTSPPVVPPATGPAPRTATGPSPLPPPKAVEAPARRESSPGTPTVTSPPPAKAAPAAVEPPAPVRVPESPTRAPASTSPAMPSGAGSSPLERPTAPVAGAEGEPAPTAPRASPPPTARDDVAKRAETGAGRGANPTDAQAQFELGRDYASGRGVERNLATAAAWFTKAADQGYPPAQVSLGRLYESGQGVGKDDAAATRLYEKAASQGDASAELMMGVTYFTGRGVGRNMVMAANWYRKAADHGSSAAQSNLGWMYENGRGVLRDEAEAFRLYLRSAEQGYPQGQFHLARAYENGRGTAKNEALALSWYRKAAGGGNADAIARLKELDATPRK